MYCKSVQDQSTSQLLCYPPWAGNYAQGLTILTSEINTRVCVCACLCARVFAGGLLVLGCSNATRNCVYSRGLLPSRILPSRVLPKPAKSHLNNLANFVRAMVPRTTAASQRMQYTARITSAKDERARRRRSRLSSRGTLITT